MDGSNPCPTLDQTAPPVHNTGHPISQTHTDLEPTEHWSCVPTGAVLEQRADLESWHAWRGRQTGVLAGKTRWPQVCRCSRRSPQTRKRRLSRRRQRCAVSDHGPPNWTQRHRRTADHCRVFCSECDCSPVMPDHRSSTTSCWLHSAVVNSKTTVTVTILPAGWATCGLYTLCLEKRPPLLIYFE